MIHATLFNFKNITKDLHNIASENMDLLSTNMFSLTGTAGVNASLNLKQNISEEISQKRNTILNSFSNIISNFKFNFSNKGGANASALGLSIIPQFAAVGFPEDGLFMTNRTEFIGRFANGKTAVANNAQITESISSSVQAGNQENNMLMRQKINLLQRQHVILMGILQKEFGISKIDAVKAARYYSRKNFRKTANLLTGQTHE